MLKGRGRDPRAAVPATPAHLAARQAARAPLARPEPDYEVVEFPTEQYVNAKLQPPPTPPRPPTGHPAEAGASCGLCGGGGARVRCAECGRRALCASCDDMYHRHPKRRNHQRQALSPSQMREEQRPPLPPKATAPVPPPRRHKMGGDRSSASPRPPVVQEQRRATIGNINTLPAHSQVAPRPLSNHGVPQHPIPPHLQKLTQQPSAQVGSMPYLPTNQHQAAVQPVQPQSYHNTIGHSVPPAWGRPRTSIPAFNMPPNMQMQPPPEAWETPDMPANQWARPLRRGASVLELAGQGCPGCAHCGPAPWRYGSCASLDHQAWPAWQPPPCCPPPSHAHMRAHPHPHAHSPMTPQPYRRVDSRAMSRAASRTGSRAASPAMSVRSRASRRGKHRTPSPPPLPSSDADSESDGSDDVPRAQAHTQAQAQQKLEIEEDSLGPAPPPPEAPWQCEHCTFVNEAGVRVCAVCCRTPTAAPRVLPAASAAPTVPDAALGRLRVAEDDAPARSKQNGERMQTQAKRDRASTGCGPSPPREDKSRKPTSRLVTPVRDTSDSQSRRHDMAVGSSPPRDYRQNAVTSPPREITYNGVKRSPQPEPPARHSVSVGPSPPRENIRTSQKTAPEPPVRHSVSVGPSPPREHVSHTITPRTGQKKSTGTSPPRGSVDRAATVGRSNVSNTGTSPPPQNISTQTYEVPTPAWERGPSAARSRSRRRFRDDPRRERSHSRHSLSSDTKESERSARTSGGGGGRWEWRSQRDSSPAGDCGDCGEWSEGERRRGPRITRRASHLDLRRAHHARSARRSSFYGSEAPSPEPMPHNRTISLEALVGVGAAREAERGLELARLMDEAERLGFSAAEVQAALAQSPAAPLAWLRERWPSLVAGVQAAAARLAPGALVSELEARAALARHRAAMWPAVTECVERHRQKAESAAAAVVGEERRVRGRVWGSPAGADDDAAPPAPAHAHATSGPLVDTRSQEESSDEYEEQIPKTFQDDDWMYLPLPTNVPSPFYIEQNIDIWNAPVPDKLLILPNDPSPLETNQITTLKEINLNENNIFPTKAGNNNDKQTNDNIANKVDSKENVPSNTMSIQNIDISDTTDSKQNVTEAKQNTPNKTDSNNEDVRNETENNTTNEIDQRSENQSVSIPNKIDVVNNTEDIAQKLKALLIQAGVPTIDENLLLKGLLAGNNKPNEENNISKENTTANIPDKSSTLDLGQSENDFIDAYNALTRLSPLPNVSDVSENLANTKVSSNNTKHNNNNQIGNGPISVNNETLNMEKEAVVEILHEHVDDTEELQRVTDMLIKIPEATRQEIINVEKDTITVNGASTSTSREITNGSKKKQALTKNSKSRPYNTAKSHLPVDIESRSSSSQSFLDNDRNKNLMQRDGDKMSNLNDIVDNTQKLIQQMKAEINSDINSYDDNTSHSEPEHSSNDSDISTEHESSYSESEDGSDDLTSEDKDYTSSEEETQEHSNKSTPVVARTSSEENDQFEEALDHLEEQTGAMKQTNMEMLDSIARSLQEEHTVSVHVEKTKVNQKKRQDVNNNNFAVVNSFEEIYDDLDTLPLASPNMANATNSVLKQPSKPVQNVYIKQEVDVLFFEPQPASAVIINEYKPPIFNAVVEYAEEVTQVPTEPVTLEINVQHLTDVNVDIDNADPINKISVLEDRENHVVVTDNLNGMMMETESISQIENQPIVDIDSTETTQHATNNESVTKSDQTNNQNINAQTNGDVPDNAEINLDIETRNNESPEKISTSPPKETKSNIPKLVRVLPSIKQKVEKIAPKVLASKVPVRRASVKQHPAPEPPKAHFGNVRSGHVKQLQSRLFNPKAVKTAPTSATIGAKPSTSSTLGKKKPAPPPPSKPQASKEPSPPETPSKEKKKQFFRETCRTEDEWTDSDSDDSQMQILFKPEEPARAPPSPPPPITLRRVSGQLIDLAHVRLPEGSPERQARMLLAEGATESWEQAQLAVELVSRGTEPPVALMAALECADLTAALAYLHQDCELCASRLPEHEMVSMLRCTHRCCRECARLYFTVQITERSIVDCVCPYCKEPELENLPEDAWLEYFAHLDILLKTLLEIDVHELFQRKLRDRTLARDPNFRWCVECSSGFFVHPKQKRVRCPECRSISCATCRKPWAAAHEGLTCEEYTTWLEDNDPERSVAAVQQHLKENGLECPRCHFKYSLSRGGCMHFTCTQCKYEFCYGCGKPFMMGARCGLSEYCSRLGLHAHHPRNCLFYLRDKEPHELQTLLQMNNVAFEVEAPEAGARCPVQLQRETPAGLVDAACGSEVPPKHAGLCKPHYVEYLASLARSLDPIPIMDVSELVAELRRRALPLPERGPWDTDPIYAGMCAEIVKEKIPLD